MGKSKKRGGETAHRKRIATRNQETIGRQNAMQKLFNESMRTQLEELKKQSEVETPGETQIKL